MLPGILIGYVSHVVGRWTEHLAEPRLGRSGHLRIDHRCSSRASGSASFFCVLSFSQPMTPLTSRMKTKPTWRSQEPSSGRASQRPAAQQKAPAHSWKKTHTAHKHTHKVQGISARDERELPGRLPLTAPLIRHSIFSFSGSDVVLIWTRYRLGAATAASCRRRWRRLRLLHLCPRSFYCFFSLLPSVTPATVPLVSSFTCVRAPASSSPVLIHFLSSSIFSLLAVNGAALTVTRRHLFDNSVFGSGPLLWRYHL